MEEEKHITLVIFGISGDLSKRKILPALSELYKRNLLPSNFHIIGISRKKITIGDFNLEKVFESKCEVIKMDVANIDEYRMLNERIKELNGNEYGENLFYLSVPPETLPNLIKNIGESKLENYKTKLLFEKPFGTDYNSAEKLIKETKQYFADDEVYHIDHYLAKQIVKDLITWKSSPKNEALLDKDNIKKIEIISLESLGIEGRGNFYEGTGALRDLIQSHLLEMLAIVIKGPHEDKVDVLRKLSIDEGRTVRGQYAGYNEDVGNIDSLTETFASVTCYSSDPIWEGIPFTLTTGKALDRKVIEINITTNDGIIKFEQETKINIDGQIYDYEKILFDAIDGDKTIFLGNEEILATWKLINPILESWKQSSYIFKYDKGSTLLDIIKKIK